jgi:hypothetical protein
VKAEFYNRLLARGYDASTLNNLFSKWTEREALLSKVKNRVFGTKIAKDSDNPVVFKAQYNPEM